MNYEEIVSFVSKNIKKTSAKNFDNHVAVEFCITGEGEGAFYIEVKNGAVLIEPYEYYDKDAKITTTADVLVKIVKGETTPAESFSSGALFIEGNIETALEIMNIFKVNSKKTINKKSPAERSVKAEKEIVEKTKRKTSKIAKDIKK